VVGVVGMDTVDAVDMVVVEAEDVGEVVVLGFWSLDALTVLGLKKPFQTQIPV